MTQLANLRRFTFDLVFSIFFGTQIFRLLMGGWSTLNPRNYQWISGDNTSGYIAQLFYASDRWRFPIASNPKFGLELSTSLIYSGPPLPVALPQKIFRIDPALQFIGIWLCLMIVLQIFFGILIARQLNYTSLASRFAGLLFVTPFFLYRFQVHFWLTAHFLILWAFWITIRSISRSRYYTLEISVLIVIAYTINSYLLVMTLIILSYPTVLSIIRLNKLTSSTLKHVSIVFLSFITCYLIFDYRSQKGTFVENLRMNFTGQYTEIPANLFAFFNPEVGYARNCSEGHCIFGSDPIPNHFIENFSILNFDLGGVQGNYDAFLYLGMGIMLLSLIAISMTFATQDSKSIVTTLRTHRLVMIYLFLISAYAITYKVSVGSRQLDLGDPKLLRWALSIFRASGRFMWIVAYFLIILLLAVLIRMVKKEYFSYLLFATLLIQFLDLYPPLMNRYNELKIFNSQSIPVSNESIKQFKTASQGKNYLIMFPPGTQKGWPELAYLAWKVGLESGMSQSSRINGIERSRLESEIQNSICTNSIDYKWLIAIPESEFALISKCDLRTYKLAKFDNFILLNKSQ